jgi:hypothetical protein
MMLRVRLPLGERDSFDAFRARHATVFADALIDARKSGMKSFRDHGDLLASDRDPMVLDRSRAECSILINLGLMPMHSHHASLR